MVLEGWRLEDGHFGSLGGSLGLAAGWLDGSWLAGWWAGCCLLAGWQAIGTPGSEAIHPLEGNALVQVCTRKLNFSTDC